MDKSQKTIITISIIILILFFLGAMALFLNKNKIIKKTEFEVPEFETSSIEGKPENVEETLTYQDASVDTDYYGMISIRYNAQWICKSLIDGLVAGASTYDTGDTIASWPYNASQDLIPHKPTGNTILYGVDTPSNSQGNDGDYYYQRDLAFIEDGSGFTASNNPGTSYQTRGGYKFTANDDIMIYGARIYTTTPLTSGTELRLSDDNDNILASKTDFSTLSNTWTDVMFNTPVQLESGESYYIECLVPSTCLVYFAISNLTISNKISILNGVYSANRNVDNANVYSCDILIGHEANYYRIYNQYYKQNGAWYDILGYTFTPKDYIQFVGGEDHRMNLGISINSDYAIQVDFDIDTYTDMNIILGNSDRQNDIDAVQHDNKYYIYTGSEEISISKTLTGQHTIKWDGTNVYFDTDVVGSHFPYTTNDTLYLGYRPDLSSQGYYYNGRINRVLITSISTGNPVADFRPATKESIDGVVASGVYDFVRGVFLESTLTVGNY